MKPFLAALPLLLLSVLLGACSLGGDPSADDSASPSASAPAPSGSPSGEPSGAPSDGAPSTQPDASGTPACAEVREGIDDFNTGDFEGTVSHFRKAVPLARDQATSDDSKAAQDLLEAVKYYADLAPKDYPMAAGSSLDFAKYKEITLGQCAAGVEPGQPSDTGSPGISA